MQLALERQLREFSLGMIPGGPDIPVSLPTIGIIGAVSRRQGFRLAGISSSSFAALCRDESRLRLSLHELRRRSRYYNRERGAILLYDNILNARNANFQDFLCVKNTMTGLSASNWSCSFRSAGFPAAGSYPAIGATNTLNRATTGALPLINPSGSNLKYLCNWAWNVSGTPAISMLVDLLAVADNVLGNTGSLQSIVTSALTRYTGTAAAGNMISFEVTSTLGATAAITLTTKYTNEAGTGGQSTGAIALTASATSQRLLPIAFGNFIPLASGDTGVRSIDSAQLSGSGIGGGTMAAMIYRPLMLMPSLAITTLVERNTPAALDGLLNLVVGSDSQLGCLAVFVNAGAGATSTGFMPFFYQTVEG